MPAVNGVGEPCAGEPHARFDGRELETTQRRPGPSQWDSLAGNRRNTRLRRLPSALIIRASFLPYARHLYAAEHDLDPRVGEDGVEQGGELSVAVPDHVTRPAAGVFEVHNEVLRGLRYSGCGGMRGRAQDPDPPVRVLDRSQDVQPGTGQGDRLEEVTREKCVGLGA